MCVNSLACAVTQGVIVRTGPGIGSPQARELHCRSYFNSEFICHRQILACQADLLFGSSSCAEHPGQLKCVGFNCSVAEHSLRPACITES